MLAPNAPAPFADVPNPLWICTLDIIDVKAGIFTQNTSCDSASLRVIPLRVTLICEPFEPLTVILEYPRPVPPSLTDTTDGCSDRFIGREFRGLARRSSSLPSIVKVTGVSLPALDDETTTLSSLSTFSSAASFSTPSAEKGISALSAAINKKPRIMYAHLCKGLTLRNYAQMSMRLCVPTPALSGSGSWV